MSVSRFRICLLLSGLGLLLQQPLSADHHKHCERCAGDSKRCERCSGDSKPCDQCRGITAVPVLLPGSSQLGSMLPLVVFPEAATPANQTFLVVNCPHEAEVRIDNVLTKSTGPSRLFRLSSDQSHLPHRVQISFTTYASKYRTEHEYKEDAHCQPGKTTIISIKKEDMPSRKICDSDCPTSPEGAAKKSNEAAKKSKASTKKK